MGRLSSRVNTVTLSYTIFIRSLVLLSWYNFDRKWCPLYIHTEGLLLNS